MDQFNPNRTHANLIDDILPNINAVEPGFKHHGFNENINKQHLDKFPLPIIKNKKKKKREVGKRKKRIATVLIGTALTAASTLVSIGSLVDTIVSLKDRNDLRNTINVMSRDISELNFATQELRSRSDTTIAKIDILRTQIKQLEANSTIALLSSSINEDAQLLSNLIQDDLDILTEIMFEAREKRTHPALLDYDTLQKIWNDARKLLHVEISNDLASVETQIIKEAFPLPIYDSKGMFLPKEHAQYVAFFEDSDDYAILSSAEFSLCLKDN